MHTDGLVVVSKTSFSRECLTDFTNTTGFNIKSSELKEFTLNTSGNTVKISLHNDIQMSGLNETHDITPFTKFTFNKHPL